MPDEVLFANAESMAVYTASSPLIGANNKGGINTAINYGKNKKIWSKFISLLNIVPKEFTNTRSSLFYKFQEKEEIVNPVASSEVSLAFNNPEKLVAQMPLCLVQIDLMKSNLVKLDYAHLLPFARAYHIDTLFFTPELPRNLIRYMDDKVHEVREKVETSLYPGYQQDMGMVVPKVSASMARLRFSQEITKDLIDHSVLTWEDTFSHVAHAASTQLNQTAKDISLFPNSRKLYFWLVDHYGYNVNIPKKKIYASKLFHVFELEEAV